MLLQIKSNGWGKNPFKIHLVRYADDFVITGATKGILEQRVKPVIEEFLTQRGLELSPEKTLLTHIDEGFDFLGKNLRKFNGKLIIQPSKKNVETFLHKVQETFNQHRTAKTSELLYRLNSMKRGWAMYHRMDNAKQAFSYVDNRIWQMAWKWALRRHGKKGIGWIKQRYFKEHQGRTWTLFDYDEHGNLVTLYNMSSLSIKYHTLLRGYANPYDADDELYFEQRNDRIMLDKLVGRNLLTIIYRKQKGICPICQQKLTKQSGWNSHHIIPRYLGGKSTVDNLVLLHPVCHIQVHSPANSVAAAALT